MGLTFSEKAIFLPIRSISQLKIRYKCVQYFNLGHAHEQTFLFCFVFLRFPFQIFLLALYIAFLGLFFSPPFLFHIIFFLHGCRKKLGVNYEQSLEMGPFFNLVPMAFALKVEGVGTKGVGTRLTIFAPNLIKLCFN